MIRRIESPTEIDPTGSDIQFLRSLGGPSLIFQPGQDTSRCRVVSTLLHGNEPSGARAVQRWLAEGRTPRTNVLFYLGSVEAAVLHPEFSRRHLLNQRDPNRCFFAPFTGDEGRLAEQLLFEIGRVEPEAVIDLHNNSGQNPAYGVVTRLSRSHRQMVSFFASKCVVSDLRLGTLIEAVDPIAPSVVIECGRAGAPEADAVAFSGLCKFLMKDEVIGGGESEPALDVLEHPLRVTIRSDVTLAFGTGPTRRAAFTLRMDIDRHNFELAEPGTVLGWLAPDCPWPFDALGADGRDHSRELFELEHGIVRFRKPMIPVMMTLDVAIAKSDCLFYVTSRRPAAER